MVSRSRSQSAAGTYTRVGINIPGDVPIERSYTAMYKTFGDLVGHYMDENPASSSLVQRRPASYSGNVVGSDGRGYSYKNWPSALHTDNVTHLPIYDVPYDMALYTEGAAAANPAEFSGQFSPIVSLIELREIPRMAKTFLDLSWKRIAGGYIEYSFGYAPIISDIKAMFSLPASIEKRINELNFLRSNEGRKISRSRSVFQKSVSTDPWHMANASVGFGISAKFFAQKFTDFDARVTTHWTPTDSLENLTDLEMARLARDQALSLTPETFLRQAYDLLPWSWLVDYFSNLGDLLSATNNSIAYSTGPGSLSKVWKTSIRGYWREFKRNPLNQVDSITFYPGSATRRDWTRVIIPNPMPSLRGPLLTSHQTSILASLGTAFAISKR